MEQYCLLPHTFGGLFGLVEVEGAVFWVEVKGGASYFLWVWNSFVSAPFFARVQ